MTTKVYDPYVRNLVPAHPLLCGLSPGPFTKAPSSRLPHNLKCQEPMLEKLPSKNCKRRAKSNVAAINRKSPQGHIVVPIQGPPVRKADYFSLEPVTRPCLPGPREYLPSRLTTPAAPLYIHNAYDRNSQNTGYGASYSPAGGDWRDGAKMKPTPFTALREPIKPFGAPQSGNQAAINVCSPQNLCASQNHWAEQNYCEGEKFRASHRHHMHQIAPPQYMRALTPNGIPPVQQQIARYPVLARITAGVNRMAPTQHAAIEATGVNRLLNNEPLQWRNKVQSGSRIEILRNKHNDEDFANYENFRSGVPAPVNYQRNGPASGLTTRVSTIPNAPQTSHSPLTSPLTCTTVAEAQFGTLISQNCYSLTTHTDKSTALFSEGFRPLISKIPPPAPPTHKSHLSNFETTANALSPASFNLCAPKSPIKTATVPLLPTNSSCTSRMFEHPQIGSSDSKVTCNNNSSLFAKSLEAVLSENHPSSDVICFVDNCSMRTIGDTRSNSVFYRNEGRSDDYRLNFEGETLTRSQTVPLRSTRESGEANTAGSKRNISEHRHPSKELHTEIELQRDNNSDVYNKPTLEHSEWAPSVDISRHKVSGTTDDLSTTSDSHVRGLLNLAIRPRLHSEQKDQRSFNGSGTAAAAEKLGRSRHSYSTASSSNSCRCTTTESADWSLYQDVYKPRFTRLAPTHLAPTHLAPTHLAPTHLAPTHLAPTHLAPTQDNEGDPLSAYTVESEDLRLKASEFGTLRTHESMCASSHWAINPRHEICKCDGQYKLNSRCRASHGKRHCQSVVHHVHHVLPSALMLREKRPSAKCQRKPDLGCGERTASTRRHSKKPVVPKNDLHANNQSESLSLEIEESLDTEVFSHHDYEVENPDRLPAATEAMMSNGVKDKKYRLEKGKQPRMTPTAERQSLGRILRQQQALQAQIQRCMTALFLAQQNQFPIFPPCHNSNQMYIADTQIPCEIPIGMPPKIPIGMPPKIPIGMPPEPGFFEPTLAPVQDGPHFQPFLPTYLPGNSQPKQFPHGITRNMPTSFEPPIAYSPCTIPQNGRPQQRCSPPVTAESRCQNICYPIDEPAQHVEDCFPPYVCTPQRFTLGAGPPIAGANVSPPDEAISWCPAGNTNPDRWFMGLAGSAPMFHETNVDGNVEQLPSYRFTKSVSQSSIQPETSDDDTAIKRHPPKSGNNSIPIPCHRHGRRITADFGNSNVTDQAKNPLIATEEMDSVLLFEESLSRAPVPPSATKQSNLLESSRIEYVDSDEDAVLNDHSAGEKVDATEVMASDDVVGMTSGSTVGSIEEDSEDFDRTEIWDCRPAKDSEDENNDIDSAGPVMNVPEEQIDSSKRRGNSSCTQNVADHGAYNISYSCSSTSLRS